LEPNIRKEVEEVFITKFNCAQTVLALVTTQKQLFIPQLPYLAAGLGGGIGG